MMRESSRFGWSVSSSALRSSPRSSRASSAVWSVPNFGAATSSFWRIVSPPGRPGCSTVGPSLSCAARLIVGESSPRRPGCAIWRVVAVCASVSAPRLGSSSGKSSVPGSICSAFAPVGILVRQRGAQVEVDAAIGIQLDRRLAQQVEVHAVLAALEIEVDARDAGARATGLGEQRVFGGKLLAHDDDLLPLARLRLVARRGELARGLQELLAVAPHEEHFEELEAKIATPRLALAGEADEIGGLVVETVGHVEVGFGERIALVETGGGVERRASVGAGSSTSTRCVTRAGPPANAGRSCVPDSSTTKLRASSSPLMFGLRSGSVSADVSRNDGSAPAPRPSALSKSSFLRRARRASTATSRTRRPPAR